VIFGLKEGLRCCWHWLINRSEENQKKIPETKEQKDFVVGKEEQKEKELQRAVDVLCTRRCFI